MISATTPLSRSLAKQGSTGGTFEVRTAAADNLDDIYGLAGIRSLVENAILLNTEVHDHHSNNADNDFIAFDHKLYSLGKDTDGNVAVYRITVEEAYQDHKHTNERRFHNLKYIEKVATVGGRTADQSLHDVSTNDNIATAYSISALYSFVKQFDKVSTCAPL